MISQNIKDKEAKMKIEIEENYMKSDEIIRRKIGGLLYDILMA